MPVRRNRQHRASRTLPIGYVDPKMLVHALDDPLLALAAAVALQAAGECSASLDAHDLLHSSWFDLFADAIESEPARLRARLGVPAAPSAGALRDDELSVAGWQSALVRLAAVTAAD